MYQFVSYRIILEYLKQKQNFNLIELFVLAIIQLIILERLYFVLMKNCFQKNLNQINLHLYQLMFNFLKFYFDKLVELGLLIIKWRKIDSNFKKQLKKQNYYLQVKKEKLEINLKLIGLNFWIMASYFLIFSRQTFF